MRLVGLSFIVLWSVGVVTASASEPWVTGTYYEDSDVFLVQFVLHNGTDSYADMWSVSTGDATSPVAPEGWRIYQSFRDVNWSAENIASFVPPYGSKGGFGFSLDHAPGTLGWWVMTAHGYTGSVTPTLIPEPSSLAALAAGMMGLGGVVMRRRR